MSDLAPDPDLAARFMERMFGRQRAALLEAELPAERRHGFLTLVQEGQRRSIGHLDITRSDWLDILREEVVTSAELGAELFFGCALRRRDLGPFGQGKQQPQQLMSLGHLFAEADYQADPVPKSLLISKLLPAAPRAHAASGLAPREKVLSSLQRFSPRPDIVIGSGNGFHAYWLLQDPLWLNEKNFGQVKTISRNWQIDFQKHFAKEAINGIDSVMNLDRILRVPGSINHKRGQKRPVGVVWGL